MAIISINKSQIYLNKLSMFVNKKISVTLIDITFENLVNFQQTVVGSDIKWGVVTISGGTFYGGKSPYILSSGVDGYLQYEITDDGFSIDNFNTGLGFALSNTLIPGDNYDYFIYIEGATGNYKTYDMTNGYLDSGIPAGSGDIVKMKRIGSTISVEYYRSGLWNPIITFPTTTTATLYIYGGGFDIGEYEYIVNPKGYNLSI